MCALSLYNNDCTSDVKSNVVRSLLSFRVVPLLPVEIACLSRAVSLCADFFLCFYLYYTSLFDFCKYYIFYFYFSLNVAAISVDANKNPAITIIPVWKSPPDACIIIPKITGPKNPPRFPNALMLAIAAAPTTPLHRATCNIYLR